VEDVDPSELTTKTGEDPDVFSEERLAKLDAEGVPAESAVAYVGPPPDPGTFASPHAFVAENSGTNWLKRKAQDGLAAELIAGRLGAMVDASPGAGVVDVPEEAVKDHTEATHFKGRNVGIRDRPGTTNVRNLGVLFGPEGKLDPKVLDPASRARTVVFQSWLGVQDGQVLINATTGRVESIDHGAWASSVLSAPPDPTPVVTDIPGCDDVGKTPELVEEAVERIEAVSDEELLEAVARVPEGPEWGLDRPARLALVRALALRRDRLRAAMTTWTTT
jgi:hypothetical protein